MTQIKFSVMASFSSINLPDVDTKSQEDRYDYIMATVEEKHNAALLHLNKRKTYPRIKIDFLHAIEALTNIHRVMILKGNRLKQSYDFDNSPLL